MGVADTVKEQNEKMLASVAGATSGTVLAAQTVVDVMGESTIKTTNPILVCTFYDSRGHRLNQHKYCMLKSTRVSRNCLVA